MLNFCDFIQVLYIPYINHIPYINFFDVTCRSVSMSKCISAGRTVGLVRAVGYHKTNCLR